MTRLIRVLLVVMVAAVSVSVMISTADARPKKPGAAESQKKSCKLPGKLGTLEHGGELLEEDPSGDGINVITCNNGTVCVKAIFDSGDSLKTCWYSPASLFPAPSSGAALAPSVALATTG
jgi:hypothetical protein